MLEALLDQGDGVRAYMADCVRGGSPELGLLGVKIPEPGAERSSLPSEPAVWENEGASDQHGECDHHDCD
jgi:hypothetical protein